MSTLVPQWRELYRLAITELNREKIPERVAEAEMALVLRMEQLRVLGGDDETERHDIRAALNGLHTIKRDNLNLSNRMPPPQITPCSRQQPLSVEGVMGALRLVVADDHEIVRKGL